jgi:hypothetical protein
MPFIDAARRLLRDRRGAATAEGAIVIMFMAIIFGATLFAYRGYRAAASTVGTPRRAMWPEALAGCPGPTETKLRPSLSGYESTAATIAPTIAPHFEEVTEGKTRRTESRTATAPRVAGGRTTSFEETSETACNTTTVEYAADIRPEVLTLFCSRHPDPEWPEGCTAAIPDR